MYTHMTPHHHTPETDSILPAHFNAWRNVLSESGDLTYSN